MVGGDFFADAMPRADAYLLMNVIHDWPDAESIKILSGIRRDMPPHARVLTIETVVPPTPGRISRRNSTFQLLHPPGALSALKRNTPSWLQNLPLEWSVVCQP